MRQNAAQLNRMQIREQEALNRQRRAQDEAAARREGDGIRRTQAQYEHVTSHGYGRSGAGAASAQPAPSHPASASGGGGGAGRRRSSLNAQVADGDDVQIKVYVRECDENAGETFTYRESGGRGGGPHSTQPTHAAGAASSLPRAAREPRVGPGGSGGGSGSGQRSPAAGGAAALAHSGGGGGGAAVSAAAGKSDGLVAPNRARIPRYLQQRKAEMAAEKEAVAAEAERQRQLSQIPPGHRRVSEDEKASTLRSIDERQHELETQLAKIPVRFDTQSIQQRRRAIEDELRQLETKRNKYSTKNPLYVPLS